MAIKKQVLITAGPTWVAIDKVRVISNIASGETGFILAEKLKKLGYKVTLLLGEGSYCGNVKGVKLVRFKYYSELKPLIKRELKTNRYGIIIHSAAVSDYKPDKTINRKVTSRLGSWKINLVPTVKLINSFKEYPGLFTVGFKFEPDKTKSYLVKEAKSLLKQAGLDLVVANSSKGAKYCAYILDDKDYCGPFFTKEKMAASLVKKITDKIR